MSALEEYNEKRHQPGGLRQHGMMTALTLADAAVAELVVELANAAELVLAYSRKARTAQDENRRLFDRAAKDEDRAEQAEAELADLRRRAQRKTP